MVHRQTFFSKKNCFFLEKCDIIEVKDAIL